jgi:hypothetical protein
VAIRWWAQGRRRGPRGEAQVAAPIRRRTHDDDEPFEDPFSHSDDDFWEER